MTQFLPCTHPVTGKTDLALFLSILTTLLKFLLHSFCIFLQMLEFVQKKQSFSFFKIIEK